MNEITTVKVSCFCIVKYDRMRVSPLKIRSINHMKEEFSSLGRNKCVYVLIIIFVIAIGLGSVYVSVFDSN